MKRMSLEVNEDKQNLHSVLKNQMENGLSVFFISNWRQAMKKKKEWTLAIKLGGM